MMVLVEKTTMERMTAVATDPSAAAPPATTLSVEPAERLDRPQASSSLIGVNRWVALGAALLLHVAILVPIWLQFDWAPRPAPPSEEIPVEIVVEQPKPPPQPQPQPSSEPAPPKPPIDLEPAHDAPRAATEDKTPHDAAEPHKNAEAKAAPDQPQVGDKAASSDAAKPVERSSDRQAEAKDDNGPQKASDDPLALAEPPSMAAVAPDTQVKVATMIGQPLPTWSKGKQFSTFDPVPDVQFGDAAASPVGGGQAQTTYLTIVYGLIMKHLRMTDQVRAEAEQVVGAISFAVDGHGDILQRSVTKPSGLNALDAAALEAVREAAPYPTPPMGMPVGMKFTYGGKSGG
ncbi:MAG: cell envelope integrity protein TolA [Roseiarcus sp.]|jgi:protein TonB